MSLKIAKETYVCTRIWPRLPDHTLDARVIECSKRMVGASKVNNWDTDPFSAGAYAHKTVDTPSTLKILSVPVGDTIFFAGEAYYEGTEMGTVEAALASGKKAAERCLSSMLNHKIDSLCFDP